MRARAARMGSSISPAAVSPAQVAPEIVSFTATPRVVSPGQTVTLAWKTRGAPSVAMEWGPALNPVANMKRRSQLPASGTMTDQPRQDTVYVLECETASGDMCMSASATVSVK